MSSFTPGSYSINGIGCINKAIPVFPLVYDSSITGYTPQDRNRAQAARLLDQYGFESQNTPMGQIRVSENVRLAGGIFAGTTPDASFWTYSGVSGGNAVILPGSELSLSVDSTPTASSYLYSRQVARYIGASANYFRGTVRLSDTGLANNVRRWGAFDTGNGFFFQLSGDGANRWGIGSRVNGVDTVMPSTGWAYCPSCVETVTDLNDYEIYWTSSDVYYAINGRLIYSASAHPTPLTGKLSLRAGLTNYNIGAVADNPTIYTNEFTISRLGQRSTSSAYRNIVGANSLVLKQSAGHLHRLVINRDGAQSTSVTIYDGVSADYPKIATVDISKVANPTYLEYNCDFNDGLYVVSVGATVDVTIVFE